MIGRRVLDGVDPIRVGREVSAVDDARGPDLSRPRLAVNAREILVVQVFPILVHRGALHGIAHRAGGGHLAVVHHAAEQIHADPRLHRLGARFLVLTRGTARAARVGVAFPHVEHAQERLARVGAIVVAVALHDLLHHRAVVGQEAAGLPCRPTPSPWQSSRSGNGDR